MIILNEKEYAEECLKNRIINNKPFATLLILAKYYYHCFGYKKKKITQLLTEYMDKYCPCYSDDRLRWDDTIEKIAANVKKFTLFEIDGIWITKLELETIKNINNKVLERLAFTMLCIAKLNNIKNPQNNGWVNTSVKEIFDIAKIPCSIANRYAKLNMLNQINLLEFPKKNDNLSSRVTFINNESEKVLFISDFRELGYEYLKYMGDIHYTRCRECRRLFKINVHNKIYCPACHKQDDCDYKYITCIDCGKLFEVKNKNNTSSRCAKCQEKKNKEKRKIWYEKAKEKNNK